jgi:uncharacterized protein
MAIDHSPGAAAVRHPFPDLARAFALFGIAVVNVGLFAYPSALGYSAGGLRSPADHAAWFAVAALFLFKSYTLFSFMFGVGFAQQLDSAARAGASFAARYWRRLLGLLAFGVLNVVALFYGDILIIYALLGAVPYAFRRASPERLVRWAKGFYVVQVLVVAGAAAAMWAWSAAAPSELAAERAVAAAEGAALAEAFRSASFATVAAARVALWRDEIAFGLALQGFGVLAMFLWGLAAARRGLVADPAAPFWARARRTYLPAGLALNVAGAVLLSGGGDSFDPVQMAGLSLVVLGSPFSTAGYLGLIAAWAARPMTPAKAFLARGGSATLTAYLLQGLLLSLAFAGYGLGLYGEPGAAAAVGIAAVAAVASIAFTSLWCRRFGRGPAETLLRAWTYLGGAPAQSGSRGSAPPTGP